MFVPEFSCTRDLIYKLHCTHTEEEDGIGHWCSNFGFVYVLFPERGNGMDKEEACMSLPL